MVDKSMTVLASASAFSNADMILIRKSGETDDRSMSGQVLANYITSTVITSANPLSIFAAGSAYSLTQTAALLDFGTTDPSVTISAPGSYTIRATVVLDYNNSTFATAQPITLKVRRTNNTAADLTNSSISLKASVVASATGTLSVASWSFPYSTSNTDDIIQLWGSITSAPSTGSLDASYASIVLDRKQL